MKHLSFLVEVGAEELPPNILLPLRNHFSRTMLESLEQSMCAAGMCSSGDIAKSKQVQSYATPRRLAVRGVNINLAPKAGTEVQKIEGPHLEHAFDEKGQAQKAASGFARKHNINKLGDLKSLMDYNEKQRAADKDYPAQAPDGKAWLCTDGKKLIACVLTLKPKISDLLLSAAEAACSAPPGHKTMRWGGGDAQFHRPVRWALILYDTSGKSAARPQSVSGKLLGVPLGKRSSGHPFMTKSPSVEVLSIDGYERQLKKEKVIASLEEREALIRRGVQKLADQLGGHVEDDVALYREVSALTEWPVVLHGTFDKHYLKLPRVLLESVLNKHQRYFPVCDQKNNKLSNHFIFVSNMPDRSGHIVRGNQRVIKPRLADGEFFYEQDCQLPLEQFAEGLKQRSFHHSQQKNSADSMWDKVERMQAIAKMINKYVDPKARISSGILDKAIALCKADLQSAAVTEFPELQGFMGAQYARVQSKPPAIVTAIEEYYLPRHADDELPKSVLGTNLALADRVDTLCALMSRGIEPSGAGDPLGLRRAALGIVRILKEHTAYQGVELDSLLADIAKTQYPKNKEVASKVSSFIKERTMIWFYQSLRFPRGMVDAVQAALKVTQAPSPIPFQVHDYHQRLSALTQYGKQHRQSLENIAALQKRLLNILPATESPLTKIPKVAESLFADKSEGALYKAIQNIPKIQIAGAGKVKESRDYASVLKAIAAMKPVVEGFFDNVMVMDKNSKVRQNRINLLAQLELPLRPFGDLSKINIKNQ